MGVVFLSLKLVNNRFHYLFDTTEPVIVEEGEKDSEQEGKEKKGKTPKSQNNGLNDS